MYEHLLALQSSIGGIWRVISNTGVVSDLGSTRGNASAVIARLEISYSYRP